MRLAFFYPQRCINQPIDPPNIWTSPRGLTGSELACVQYATHLAKLGHSVNLFTRVNRAADKDSVIYIPYGEWETTYHNQYWDACLSWMDPEPLKIAHQTPFRFFNQQVSDFGGCAPGWESYIDILAPLSVSHANQLRGMCSVPEEKWRVLLNGTDTSYFRPGKKIPGKMIWASSHDRGLHWLLEMFPQVKKAVPHAELHIFYNTHGLKAFSSWPEQDLSTPQGRFAEELARRSRYSADAMRRLSGKGVICHESVSREQIRDEMATSQVLAYPLDPVRYTETFGVTVLEAFATGVIPVLCFADCFAELWGNMAEGVPAPYTSHKAEFLEKTIEALRGDRENKKVFDMRVGYAKHFEWSRLAKSLEKHLETRGKEGLSNPWIPEQCWWI